MQLVVVTVLAANRFTFTFFSKRVYDRLWAEWVLVWLADGTFLLPFGLITPQLYVEAYYFLIQGPAAVINDDYYDNDDRAIT